MPAAPALAMDPDLLVLHRSDGTVQLGWGPETASILVPPEGTDAFGVGVLLRLLDGTRTREEVLAAASERGVPSGAAEVLLDEMLAAGTIRPGAGATGTDTGHAPRVRVYGSGLLASAMVAHLAPWDVRWFRSPPTGENHRLPARSVDCVVLTDMQVPDPYVVSLLMDRSIPHMTVRIRDGHGVVGPFVVPGRTSCLRCADLVRADLDPSWPRLASQLYGRQARAERAVALTTAAVAVGQLDAFFASDPAVAPAFDRTLEVDLRSHRITTRRWFRHPECGCSATAATGRA